MKITISGKPGSGKNTVAYLLAKKLNMKVYCATDFVRKIAREKKIPVIKVVKKKGLNKLIDEKTSEIGKRDNVIIVGRVGYYFVKDAYDIYLDVSLDAGAERILKDKRKSERFASFKEARKKIKQRIEEEKDILKKLYDTNPHDKRHYDLVIDTTKISAKKVAGKIIKKIT